MMLIDRIFQFLPGNLSACLIGRLAKHHAGSAAKINLIVMNRGRLQLDIAAMIGKTPINFITIKALRYKALLSRFVAPEERVQTLFQKPYLQGDAKRREKMQALAVRMLDCAGRGRKIDGVVVANVDYWPDEALKDVCQARGIGFFVLGRENYAHADSPQFLADRFKEYEFQFRGTAIAMASDESRDAMRQGRIADPEAIVTTGWPRFDGWVTEPAKKQGAFLTLVDYSHHHYGMQENAHAVLEAFLAAAKFHKGKARFAIKFKRYSDLWRVLWRYPGLYFAGVKLIASGPMQPLLKQSTGIIGAGSMGMVEAYLADAAVVIPWWADAVGKSRAYFSPDVAEDAATSYFPTDVAALRQLIDGLVAGEIGPKGERQGRLSQFRRYAAFDDKETAAVKFARLVSEHLQN